jgi:hypothetical protein
LASDRLPHGLTFDGQRLSDPAKHCRALLASLDEQDQRLPKALFRPPQIVDYVIAAWIAEDPSTCDAYFSFDEENLCPISGVFSLLLAFDTTRQRVFDTLYSQGRKSKKLRVEVVRAAISRCTRIAQLEREAAEAMVAPDPDLPPSTPRGKEEKPMSAVEAALRYLAQIQDVMPRLCSNTDISVAILRSTFFEEYTRALHSWLDKISSSILSKLTFSSATGAPKQQL